MLNFNDVSSTKFDGNILVFKDGRLVEFNLGSWLSDNANALKAGDSPAGLKIRILASASGILVNNRVYPGREWKRAVKKFEGRPILKHHDSLSDAIGRIQSAHFKQLVFGDAFKNDHIKPAIQGKGQPTGLVYVDALITDLDAIQKIQDERLLHTSQGSRAGGAYCSVCDSNWAKGNYCDHTPGRIHKDEDSGKKQLIFWRIADLEPGEVSLVNNPALSQSRIVSTDSMVDSHNDRFMEMLEEASRGTAMALGDNVTQFFLTDHTGHTQDIRVVKEENYDILDLSNQVGKDDTDNESAGESILPKEINMSDTAVDTKVLETEISGLKDQVSELIESNKDLREEKKALEEKVADKQSTLDTLQDEYNALLETVQGELIDSYLEVAGVAKEQLEATKTHLSTLDADTLRFMLSEAKRLKVVKAPVTDEGIQPEADGTQGGTAQPEVDPKVTIKPRKRKSSLRK